MLTMPFACGRRERRGSVLTRCSSPRRAFLALKLSPQTEALPVSSSVRREPIVASRSYTCRSGRLRRPRPLPRAVREPLPARFPGEVPRLGARDPLVARQPARADGRLPRRLRPALAGRRRSRTTRCTCWRASPAGSSSRRRFRPARARSSTAPSCQEGALPAPARPVLGRRDAARDVRGDARDPDRAVARLHPATRGRRSGSRSRSGPLFVCFVAGVALLVASRTCSSATSSTSSRRRSCRGSS